LLLTTLFRLAINVSVTRLVLLHGDAGHVVKAFGEFVVGGNIVVGLVVFCILVVIQFVVITNGSGRVAEVAARFTLDAMPGKQMAIDADLNAGQITDDEARRRRKEIADEADFYGAMDGASKFVKGDAMAAVLITAINLIGGIVVGVVQQGRPIGDAINHFSLLSGVSAVRKQIAAQLGTVVPSVRIHDEVGMGSHEYAVKVRGVEVARGSVMAGHQLALDPGDAVGQLQGVPTTEPAFGLPALWIADGARAEAEALGYTVVDPESVIVTHLTETIRVNVAELLTRQDVRALL